MQSTVGQLLINDALPEELRDHTRTLDKKGINNLLRRVAREFPDQYRDISHKLSQIGWRAAQETGGYSFDLTHMRKSKAGAAVQARLTKKLATILNDDDLSDEDRNKMILLATGRELSTQQDAIYEEALAAKNPLAFQVKSGSRGNKMNLSSLLGSDLLYTDQSGDAIPMPVLRSYSQGLTPSEYWAGTYGARKGVLATKMATQDAGFLSKQLNQMSHRLVVTGDDDEDEDEGGRTNFRGVPVDVEDMDSEGSLLAADIGDFKRNTILTPKILRHIKRSGHKRVLVRSPIVGGSRDGGVYARDVGIRETGSLPVRGEMVGLAASQALSEPLSQAQLSAKHSGGVAGQEKSLSGFAYLNQLLQVPKTFKDGATHSEHDGIVSDITPAPAGGFNVHINGEQHYVPDSVALKVKKGQRIEAGDVLSEGIPNPSKIVEHKGIGEGRRYFSQTFKQAMTSSGLGSNRRNIELLSRGLINHVKLTDEFGDHVPDDIIPYSSLERNWKPRDGFETLPIKRAVGKHLERPVLHYSIGTKIRPSMLKDFEEFGVSDLDVHADPPPFQSTMVRAMSSLQHDPDWMTRMYGSGLKGSLLKGVHRGSTSDEEGTSFVPSVARAVEFGRIGSTKGPQSLPQSSPAPVLPAGTTGSLPTVDPVSSVETIKQAIFDGTDGVPGAPTTNYSPKPAGSFTAGSGNPYAAKSGVGGSAASQFAKPMSPSTTTSSYANTQPPAFQSQPQPAPQATTAPSPFAASHRRVQSGRKYYANKGYSPEEAIYFSARDVHHKRPEHNPTWLSYPMAAIDTAFAAKAVPMGAVSGGINLLTGRPEKAFNDFTAPFLQPYNRVMGTAYGDGASSAFNDGLVEGGQSLANAYNDPAKFRKEIGMHRYLAGIRENQPLQYQKIISKAANGDPTSLELLSSIAKSTRALKAGEFEAADAGATDAENSSGAYRNMVRGFGNFVTGVGVLAGAGNGPESENLSAAHKEAYRLMRESELPPEEAPAPKPVEDYYASWRDNPMSSYMLSRLAANEGRGGSGDAMASLSTIGSVLSPQALATLTQGKARTRLQQYAN